MINEIFGFISRIVNPVTNMVDDIVTSEEERKKIKNELIKLQNDLAMAVMKHEEEKIKAQKEIIISEIKGGWLTRNWRPVLMLSIVAIVVNNYILYPYLSIFWDNAIVLDLPEKMWDLMKIGVGGYVVGRSGEKIAKFIKNKGD